MIKFIHLIHVKPYFCQQSAIHEKYAQFMWRNSQISQKVALFLDQIIKPWMKIDGKKSCIMLWHSDIWPKIWLFKIYFPLSVALNYCQINSISILVKVNHFSPQTVNTLGVEWKVFGKFWITTEETNVKDKKIKKFSSFLN